MFDKAKDMYNFQRQARQIQKELKKSFFVASSSNGVVQVTANGLQEVTEIKLEFGERGPDYLLNSAKLAREIVDTVNKALKKAQTASAEKMKGIMGSGGLPW